MFERKLTQKEINTIIRMVQFVKKKHADCEGHDYSHILEVTRYSIEIARSISETVDPFILIVGALFHDIGRAIRGSGDLHGLIGATIAEEYFEVIGLDSEKIVTITNIITSHSPTSMLPPKTVEEKIVFDADAIDRLGLIGVIRGVMGKKGSIEDILEKTIKKRSQDFHKMYFDVSREIAGELHKQSDKVIVELRRALNKRIYEINNLPLPF